MMQLRFLFFFLSGFLIFSCTVIKNPPANKPFVYETNVNVEGNLSNDERKNLQDQLQQQLDDSMKVPAVRSFAGFEKSFPFLRFFYRKIINPHVYDSTNADRSIVFMRGLLHSLGYTRDSIVYKSSIKQKEDDQLQTTVDFNVYPGKLIRIDSISYNLSGDTIAASAKYRSELDTLQQITNNSLGQSYIKRGDPFSKNLLSLERDRLADVYRNNGYLRYTQDEMLVLWDTVGLALLRPTLDPAEQARLLTELAERRRNPKVDVEFRLRTNPDSARITRYYVGNVTVYPDITLDTSLYKRTEQMAGGYKFISYRNLFRPDELTEYVYLHRGDLYRQSKELRTQNKFSSLSAWRLVSIAQLPRSGQDTVDFEIRMTPAKKYGINYSIEASRNVGNLSIAEGNLIGLGLTVGVQNRNFAKAANQAATNFRYGIELNATTTNIIQTQQFFLTHTITFPRLVPHIPWLHDPEKDNDVRTLFTLSGGITDRRNYYNLASFNTSWGYEKSWSNKLLSIKLPNIEYNVLQRRDSLDTLIRKNSSYKYIFNTGFIISGLINFSIAGGKQNVTKLTSASLELPILPFNLSKDYYRFIKIDAEHRETYKIRRSAFAWRVFGGVGIALPFSTIDTLNFYLPFFRAYYAGGPNSMRAWAIRKLGPGSAVKSFASTDAPDRFGDLRLEANAEYRFYITTISGVALNSAIFTDIGNVWFLRTNKDFPGGEFNFNKLGKDIAIGVGTGLRVDFGFLKIRFDYAYKMKDPSPDDPAAQNKLFYNWQLLKGQFQLGIDYPF